MHDVVALLDAAIGHLHQEHAAHGAILEAASLLRRRVDPQPVEGVADDGKERLLAWQARKVLDYIHEHITSRVPVAARLRGCGQRAEGSAAHFRKGGHIRKFYALSLPG